MKRVYKILLITVPIIAIIVIGIIFINRYVQQPEETIEIDEVTEGVHSCSYVFKWHISDNSNLPFGFIGADNQNIGSRPGEKVSLIKLNQGYYAYTSGCTQGYAKKMVFVNMGWDEFLNVSDFRELTPYFIEDSFKELYLCSPANAEIFPQEVDRLNYIIDNNLLETKWCIKVI